jgi:hypothetical protein
MKVRLAALIVILSVFGSIQAPANAADKPVVESFTASQIDIDLNNTDSKINFEVVVSHAAGIENRSTTLVLTNSKNNSLSTLLIRTDSPIDYTKNKVTFRGTIDFPRTLDSGVYTYSLIDGLTSNLSNGIKIGTGAIPGPVLRNLKGAESGVLVRSGGFLDLDYVTINGPAYGLQNNKTYIDTAKYPSPIDPVWKVGEIFTPSDYFEVAVTTVQLEISTASPKICTTDGKTIKLISIGECTFTISTPRTKDYKAKSILQTVTIAAGRTAQKLFIENVPPRKAQNLPITITLSTVYASGTSAVENVFPKSTTPEVCDVAGYSLKVISGGNCVLTYQSLGNTSYLPSDIYTQTIVFEKASQTISFVLPPAVKVTDKTLNLTATSTSGNQVTYTSTPSSSCTISGSVLNLLKAGNCSVTATQVGTTTLASASVSSTVVIEGVVPAVKITITCVKGKTTKKVTGTNPKCPAGYKLKK